MTLSILYYQDKLEQAAKLLGNESESKLDAEIREKIAALIKSIFDHYDKEITGSESRTIFDTCLFDCVERGLYLKPLMIFFEQFPASLKVGTRQIGPGKNFLHRAVVLKPEYFSLPFVEFILKLNSIHKLELHTIWAEDNVGLRDI